ncbi:MAG TPA: response regulator transcription factor [Gaiellaceae bacterium]|jgi:DNA-binding NarL/FixJ family response regulator
MTDSTHTAVLLDPHPLWQDAVAGVLARLDIDVVGRATDIGQALSLLDRFNPSLFTTEISVGNGEADGIDLVRRVRARHPEMKQIVISVTEDRSRIAATLGAGADAYVVKAAHPDDLASAVRQAFSHSIFFAGALPDYAAPAPFAPEEAGLTPREVEILQLAAEGLSNAQVARRLWVTEQTVKFHLSNIYRKLDVANRTEASRWAQVHGLLAVAPTLTVA